VHIGRLQGLNRRRVRHSILGLLNVLVFLGLSFHPVHLVLHWRTLFSERPPGKVERLAGTEVLEAVERIPGEIISEEPIYALLTGRRVLFQPFIMSELARQGLWDQASFVADLQHTRFRALVTTQNLFNEDQYFIAWTLEMRKAIRESYRVRQEVDFGPRWHYWILIPREPPPEKDDYP
jgi:hypothetical protein